MDIKDYQEAVKYFSDNQENFEFTNKGIHHATSVVSNLIRTTKNELLIYSGSLNKDVASDSHLVKMLNIFLESGKALRVVLDHMPSDEEKSEALKQIIASMKNSKRDVILKVDSDQVFSNGIKDLFKDGEAHHFMVADKMAYRFEIDAIQYKAICNFNDEKIAADLTSAFYTLFEKMK